MSAEGMGPSLTVEGPTTSVVFETYVEHVLAPTLRRGQVVVMDNLSAHKGEMIKELIERRGCQLVYLPSYSPDLNPIEEAFSKIKRLVRKAEARTREALVEAIGSALSAVTSRDARGFFEHCGYRNAGSIIMVNAVRALMLLSALSLLLIRLLLLLAAFAHPLSVLGGNSLLDPLGQEPQSFFLLEASVRTALR